MQSVTPPQFMYFIECLASEWQSLLLTLNTSYLAPEKLASCRLQFQPCSNTPACNNQGTLNTFSWFKCVCLGLNWNLQDGSCPGAGLEIPVLKSINSQTWTENASEFTFIPNCQLFSIIHLFFLHTYNWWPSTFTHNGWRQLPVLSSRRSFHLYTSCFLATYQAFHIYLSISRAKARARERCYQFLFLFV